MGALSDIMGSSFTSVAKARKATVDAAAAAQAAAARGPGTRKQRMTSTSAYGISNLGVDEDEFGRPGSRVKKRAAVRSIFG